MGAKLNGLVCAIFSVRTLSVMYDHTFLNLQITSHQATYKVGCQPGDCIWSLIFLRGLSRHVWVNILTLSTTKGLN